MSSAAWLIDLERLPDAKLATRHAVRLAVVKLLTETWRRALPAHDAQRAFVGGHRLDERAVDFDLVDVKAPQIAEGRIARAELIDAQRAAQIM